MDEQNLPETSNDFQKEIRYLMKTYNLSEEDIASKIQVRAVTVYRWEKGLSKPRSRIIVQAYEEFKRNLLQRDNKTI